MADAPVMDTQRGWPRARDEQVTIRMKRIEIERMHRRMEDPRLAPVSGEIVLPDVVLRD
jgi:hypothetical protein